MEEIIRVNNLRKVYRMGEEKVIALDNINLTIKKGELCSILGTSGSGKSTLLNMLAGLEKPSKGEIIIKGKHLEKMNENQVTKFRQRNIGFVFQSYNLLPNLNALENVTLPLIFAGIPRAKREKKAREILNAVGLGNRLFHKPSQMSGGQQQRVSIARALVSDPEILFADEPTGNLDTKTTLEIMELITNMVKENAQTLILVTHDVETASFVNKVIYVQDGKILKINEKFSEEGKKE
ncbi:macrolide ABC transporter ATP-binding protein [Fervidicella metallireducens AeB]|uniref:Macrolide ABC transporter ATP-binding protein n=1 Tax=Fervidicella metallireducens AeB TaxID=1403537 RepID=A0A017RYW2_9CLOT|nr:ABC transporter ATP-binding protein [Fervidicella metallireducens]EYE89569.1 macrolide ABC transporter ATP-binding protein [Fervidicella metallireducens AeB]